jgi:hypothetical protein
MTTFYVSNGRWRLERPTSVISRDLFEVLDLRSRGYERIWSVRTRYIPLPRNPTKGYSFLVQLVFGRILVTVFAPT